MIDDPFSISPNPLYLYQTASIKATLHKVRYTINRRQGLTCILADVGMGKSTVLRYLFTEFDAREDVSARLIPTPNFASDFAFLKAVCGEFDLPAKRSLLDQEQVLKAFLVGEFTEQRNVVLFIDEAQRLSNKMLELVRAMLNFETNRSKLIQIILSGQLELRERLLSDKMEAIASRIIMPTVLNTLTITETAEMIDHRCRAAELENPFSAEAVEVIYEATGGTPREILKICATAYELMTLHGETEIPGELIERAIEEATLKSRPVQARAARE